MGLPVKFNIMSKIAWKELIAGVAVGSIGTELKNKYLKRRPDVNDQLKNYN